MRDRDIFDAPLKVVRKAVEGEVLLGGFRVVRHLTRIVR